MKNLFVICILLLFIVNQANAQDKTTNTASYIAFQIIGEMDGTIMEKKKDEALQGYFVIVELPSFYDLDLIKLSCKKVVNKYSAISKLTEWEYDSENELFSISYLVGELQLLVCYTKTKSLYFYFPY